MSEPTLREALAALVKLYEADEGCRALPEYQNAIAALAAPVAVEPVATVVSWTNGSYSRNYKLTWHADVPEGAKLYTAPPATQLQQAVERAREEEREACAVVCDGLGVTWWDGRKEAGNENTRKHLHSKTHGAEQCAAAIRARGTTK